MAKAAKIIPNHLAWLFESAQEHYADRMAQLEVELMRHQAFADKPLYTKGMSKVTKLRADRVKEVERSLASFAQMVLFCAEARERLADLSAESDTPVSIIFKK